MQLLLHHIRLDIAAYCQISNINRTLVGNEIGDQSNVVGASLVALLESWRHLCMDKYIHKGPFLHIILCMPFDS